MANVFSVIRITLLSFMAVLYETHLFSSRIDGMLGMSRIVSSVLVTETRALAQLAQRSDNQREGSAELMRDIGDEVQVLLLESQFPAAHAVFEVYVDEQERRACEYQHIGDFRSGARPGRRMHDQRHV